MNSDHLLNKTKKAVIYCRVSTKEQVEEGNSLATQEKICKEYAFRNGYEVVQIFNEQGESAKTANRTQLLKLLSFCKDQKNEITAVIVYRLDRMSRNTDDYSYIRLQLRSHNVEIKSTSENFEDSPVGKFLENTIANIAQFDNDVRAERCTNGMKEAMREGRYVWSAPFGYKNSKIAGRATIAPDSIKASIIKEVFYEVAKDIQPIEEVRRLYQKKGLTISKSYFYTLLKNELYIGWIIKFRERHKGLFDPIIDQDTFSRVQYVLKRRKHFNSRYLLNHPDFPLRRFIRLNDGQRITGAWAKGNRSKYPYYRFSKANIYFKKSELEDAFRMCIDAFTLKEKHYPLITDFFNKHLIAKQSEKQKQLHLAQKYVEELKAKEKMLIDKNCNGIISDTVLKEQLSIIEKEVFDNQLFIKNASEGIYKFEDLIQVAEVFLKKPSLIWEKPKIQLKSALQEFVFPSGIYVDECILRTPEICSLFKLKEAITASKSSKVDFRIPITNRGKNYHKGRTELHYIKPSINLSEKETEALLPAVVKELKVLQNIVENSHSAN